MLPNLLRKGPGRASIGGSRIDRGPIARVLNEAKSDLALAAAVSCGRSQHLVLLLADWMSAIMIQAIFYGKSQFGVKQKVRRALIKRLSVLQYLFFAYSPVAL